MTGRVEVLGVRHHGPGSARSVAHALDELDPTVVVVEGPPELDAVVELVASPELVPPVAGLVYVVDEPRRASFYPLAVFSPEWIALRSATERGVAVRFADLPAIHALAIDDDGDDPRPDPIGTLAALAGYDDAERWWEDAVEHRPASSSLARFAALRETMAGLRAAEDDAEAAAGAGSGPWRVLNERREAAMRRVVREVARDDGARVAVVCGAYHAPALDPAAFPPVAADNATLKGLPKVKVAATWAPWTAGRLAARSGYGAGVTAPGWYEHLFTTPPWEDPAASWLVRVAAALRAEQLDAPPSSVVEATRLATTLAAVRARPSVGLTELDDAVQAVLCEGSTMPLRLITDQLVVGHGLGSVPASTPMVPIAADLARQQRTLKLKASAAASVTTLDLRKPAHLAKSILFHRLTLLGIDWAVPADAGRTTGTFKEAWELQWRPELAVALIEASVFGTTVASAAATRALADGAAAEDLGRLASLIGASLLADLPDAVDGLVRQLAERTAQQHDALALLEAVEPLARSCRYGDVRATDTTAIVALLEVVVVRASVGLRAACSSLDDDGAARVRAAIEACDRGVVLLETSALLEPWERALASVADRDDVHGSVSGRVNRLLLDREVIDVEEAGRRLSRRLSTATEAAGAAAWLDGFLAGDAVLLLHDPVLLGTVDDWVSGIDDRTFEDLLPLLRRTFARFERAERRQVGELLARGRSRVHAPGDVTSAADAVDLDRAAPAVATVARLLGIALPEPEDPT